jgi:hypothetical protein
MQRYDRPSKYEEAFYMVVVCTNFDDYVNDSRQLFAYNDAM